MAKRKTANDNERVFVRCDVGHFGEKVNAVKVDANGITTSEGDYIRIFYVKEIKQHGVH